MSQARLQTPLLHRHRNPCSPSEHGVGAGVGSRSRECPRWWIGSHVRAPRVRPGGCTGELAGSNVESPGNIHRRFLFTASSMKRTCVGGASARSACTPHRQPEHRARLTHYGLRVLQLDGSSSIDDIVFQIHAEVALECMRGNMYNKWHSFPPLWVAFVIGPTSDPARYNLHL